MFENSFNWPLLLYSFVKRLRKFRASSRNVLTFDSLSPVRVFRNDLQLYSFDHEGFQRLVYIGRLFQVLYILLLLMLLATENCYGYQNN